MNEQEKLVKVLSKAQGLSNSNKNREALALINRQKGRLAAHPDLLKIKARVLAGLGRYQGSLKILQNLHSRFPRDIDVLVNISWNFNQMKAHESAVGYAENAVKLEPHNVGLLLNLASTYRSNQMIDSAVTVLRKAEIRANSHPNVVLLLSELLIEQGAYLEALERLRQVADSPSKSMLLLDCYCKLNWYKDARELVSEIEETSAVQDDYYKALFITRLQQLGEFSKIRKLLNGPAPFDSPQLLLAYIQSMSLDASVLLQLIARIEKANFEEGHKRSLFYALSEKLFDCGEDDRAFELLAVANQMQSITESEQQEINGVFDDIVETFVEWKGKSTSGSSSDVPIFVVGMPRSGTTLVENILASHSLVFGAGETQFLELGLNGHRNSAVNHLSSVRYLEQMGAWDDTQTRKVADNYLESLRQHSGESRHIVDKMPHNFLHLGVIRKIFPNAKIIHCVRHPIATCWSIYRQHLSDFHSYSTELQYLGEYYKKYRKLMAFWKTQAGDLNLIEVSYESLIADFEMTVRGLLAECGLAFEENCLLFHQQERVVSTLSTSQVRNTIYQTSMEGWKNHQARIQPLLDAFPQDS